MKFCPKCKIEKDRSEFYVDSTRYDGVRDVVYGRDKGICHICGNFNPLNNWHLDHIIPLSKGGKHAYENVAVSCPSCNLKKHDKILMEG